MIKLTLPLGKLSDHALEELKVLLLQEQLWKEAQIVKFFQIAKQKEGLKCQNSQNSYK